MDLFNSNNYFTLQVPMRFINSPVVRYAALALAAKYASVQSKNSLAAPSSIASTISSTNLAADGLQYEQLVSLFHDRALELTRVSMGDALTPASSSMNQDILTAVALICFLKLMSNPSLETGSFLGTLITEMLPAKAVLDGSSDGFRSIFFEIVRYDCLSACKRAPRRLLGTTNQLQSLMEGMQYLSPRTFLYGEQLAYRLIMIPGFSTIFPLLPPVLER